MLRVIGQDGLVGLFRLTNLAHLFVGMADEIGCRNRLGRIRPVVDNRLKALLDRRILLTELDLTEAPFELCIGRSYATFVQCHELLIFGQPHLPVFFPIVFFGDVQLVPFDFAEFLPAIQGQLIQSFGLGAACPHHDPGGSQAHHGDLSPECQEKSPVVFLRNHSRFCRDISHLLYSVCA